VWDKLAYVVALLNVRAFRRPSQKVPPPGRSVWVMLCLLRTFLLSDSYTSVFLGFGTFVRLFTGTAGWTGRREATGRLGCACEDPNMARNSNSTFRKKAP